MAGTTMLVASVILYVVALMMPFADRIVAISKFGFSKTDFNELSLLGTIEDLWAGGDVFLATVLVCFTVVFPILKFIGLGFVVYGRTEGLRHRVLGWIKTWGQWSMGDVFVVSVLVVVSKLSDPSLEVRLETRPGLFIFAGSILLTIVMSTWLAVVDKRDHAER